MQLTVTCATETEVRGLATWIPDIHGSLIRTSGLTPQEGTLRAPDRGHFPSRGAESVGRRREHSHQGYAHLVGRVGLEPTTQGL
jgi:hypothetical protein